jgi:hypothetical protein
VKNQDNNYNNYNNTNNNNSTHPNKFKITFLIAIFGIILITSTLLTLNTAAVVFAQTFNVNSSESDNQTQGLHYLCNLPPQEQARILHGMHLSGC